MDAVQHEGLALMRAEIARQCVNALATLSQSRDTASRIADAMRATGSAVLYGMGGSHHVNRIAEPLYRDAGIETHCVPASEALMSPLPQAPRVALFASQSGESGEIVEVLRTPAGSDRRFALTLNGDSTLSRAAEAALVAAGGSEIAFAATRSIVLTVAMHGAVLEALGQDASALRDILQADPATDIEPLARALVECDTIVFAGRHVMAGVAQSAALSLMELSRVPAIGFETGQFRHGPFEFLRKGIGVVLLRSSGPDCASVSPVAASALEAGCATAVLDAGSGELPSAAVRIGLKATAGLAAATQVLLALQRLNIAVALQRIPRGVGSPLRTAKVTV